MSTLAAPGSSKNRSRSKSPGGRRDRSRSPAPHAASPPRHTTSNTAEYEDGASAKRGGGFDYGTQPSYDYAHPPRVPEPPPGHGHQPTYAAQPQYDNRRYSPPPPPGAFNQPVYADIYDDPSGRLYQQQQPHPPSATPKSQYANPAPYQYADTDKHGKPIYRDPSRGVSVNTSSGFNMHVGHQPAMPPRTVPLSQGPNYASFEGISSQSMRPQPQHTHSTPVGGSYAYMDPYRYAQASEEPIKYKYGQQEHRPSASSIGKFRQEEVDEEEFVSNVIEVTPGGHSEVVGRHGRDKLQTRMHSLSVSTPKHSGALTLSAGPHGGSLPVGLPPGSPLLEAYRGTYQSISPMPSPMMLPRTLSDSDSVSDLSGLSSDSDSDDSLAARRKRQKKRSIKYDPSKDAHTLAECLRSRSPPSAPLLEILPSLTHAQILALRSEYKKHAKYAGQGINITKHIKMKLTTATSFGKICYVTALGRWEGEAYWANFWYQSGASRRELLIESLMGRTNEEVREIKAGFRDKRYGDSLEKCMRAELKADKFRTAVLLVLDEKRMEETPYVRGEQVRDDVRRLGDALASRSGGETAIIHIVVTRSDIHMREVLRLYEKTYAKNFAKEMLRKSTNLVGETLAHILNGIINRPVRDALLLHQALTAEVSKERIELLISRVIRYHWDRPHLEAIKREFRNRYGKELATVIAEGTKGDFGEFLVEAVIKH